MTEVIATDASFASTFATAVASSAAVLFQSQLASVNTTSAGNGNMLARFEGALPRSFRHGSNLRRSDTTKHPI